jgi:purine-binding chemotaxis protein CheW
MNSTGILDDYLDELLGEAIAPAAAPLPAPISTAPATATEAAAEREPTWDDLPAEVIYETETESVAAALPWTMPHWKPLSMPRRPSA